MLKFSKKVLLKSNKTKLLARIKKKTFFGISSMLFGSSLYLSNKTLLGEETITFSKEGEVNNVPYFKWEVVKPEEKEMVENKSKITQISKIILKIFDLKYLVSSVLSGMSIFLRSLQILYVFFPCIVTLPYALRDLEYRTKW
jgi:hypothetical protein